VLQQFGSRQLERIQKESLKLRRLQSWRSEYPPGWPDYLGKKEIWQSLYKVGVTAAADTPRPELLQQLIVATEKDHTFRKMDFQLHVDSLMIEDGPGGAGAASMVGRRGFVKACLLCSDEVAQHLQRAESMSGSSDVLEACSTRSTDISTQPQTPTTFEEGLEFHIGTQQDFRIRFEIWSERFLVWDKMIASSNALFLPPQLSHLGERAALVNTVQLKDADEKDINTRISFRVYFSDSSAASCTGGTDAALPCNAGETGASLPLAAGGDGEGEEGTSVWSWFGK
jgi:hypothetical protein